MRVRDADSSALTGAWVVAHAVGEQRQGPIDSMRTDAAGRFRFVVARPESATVYVVSARYQGIGYFSEPVQPGPAPGPLTLVVFDTAVTGPPLSVTIRHLVVTLGEQGQRRVLDIMQIMNPGRTTRVGPDSLSTVWSARLPDDIVSPQAGESDVPASGIRFSAGKVEVLSPFPPGLKQVVVTYDMASDSRTLELPLDQPAERLEVLVEDSTASVSSDLTPEEGVTIEGRNFRRYSADSLAAGATPSVTFDSLTRGPRQYTWIVIAAAGLALVAGAAFALRRRPAEGVAVVAEGGDPLDAESDERLRARIAALDAKFAGREAETDAARWAVYRENREALVAALKRRVARR